MFQQHAEEGGTEVAWPQTTAAAASFIPSSCPVEGREWEKMTEERDKKVEDSRERKRQKAKADGRQVDGDIPSLTTGYTHCIPTWKKHPSLSLRNCHMLIKPASQIKNHVWSKTLTFFWDHLITERPSYAATVFSKVTQDSCKGFNYSRLYIHFSMVLVKLTSHGIKYFYKFLF